MRGIVSYMTVCSTVLGLVACGGPETQSVRGIGGKAAVGGDPGWSSGCSCACYTSRYPNGNLYHFDEKGKLSQLYVRIDAVLPQDQLVELGLLQDSGEPLEDPVRACNSLNQRVAEESDLARYMACEGHVRAVGPSEPPTSTTTKGTFRECRWLTGLVVPSGSQ